MNIQQIQIPLATVVKAIKRKEQFVLGVAGIEGASTLLTEIWSDLIAELSRSLAAELSTELNHVRLDSQRMIEEGVKSNGRFQSLGTVLQWRKHRLTLVEFERTSDQLIYRFGPQCDGVVTIVGSTDRDTQKSIRALVDAGIQVLGYWPITSHNLPRAAA
ncbi:MAG: hypothetical protein MUD03_09660 [Pirellula sp.]|jgi:hypothetical protein|nr:hypothetical protein [Pirellula sp.]